MGKKCVLIIVSVVVLAIVLLGAGGYLMFREQLAAMGTIQKLEERLYTMEYRGDYGMDKFLERGGVSSSEELSVYLTEFLSHGFYKAEPEEVKQGCSFVQVPDTEGGWLSGRNFDWENCTVMVVKTKPKNGYASIATCNMDVLGFGEDYLPEGFGNQMRALAAIYVPLDGMNEKGLCVADLMIDVDEETNQDTGKPDLTTTTAIRLLLDQAADVDEAVDLLKQYDMHSDIGIMHHLAIADNSGRSVVAEYVDNELVVTETEEVTNFFLTPGDRYGIGSEQSHVRYDILKEWRDARSAASAGEVKDALQSVSQEAMGEEFALTVWSIVYEQENGRVHYFFRENYEKEYEFSVLSDS